MCDAKRTIRQLAFFRGQNYSPMKQEARSQEALSSIVSSLLLRYNIHSSNSPHTGNKQQSRATHS